MGGRGKTPLVAHLARLLLDAGERPAILSRGYGRRRAEDGVVVVSDGRHLLADLDRSGDEPLMLARAVPGAAVLVCDTRALAGALAERLFGATVHILDDGFQHLMLARDLDLVLVSPEDLNDRPAPFGRLRESAAALASADAVIVDEGDRGRGSGDRLRAEGGVPPAMPAFSLRRSLGQPRPLEPGRPWPSGTGPIVALAGIARPDRFARSLQDAGWQVAGEILFRDHHPYGPRNLARIAERVQEVGAVGVLTTDKDAVRLLRWRPLPVRIAAVPLDISVEPAVAFRSWLLDRVREARE